MIKSHVHRKYRWRENTVTLEDLLSANAARIQIRCETPLPHHLLCFYQSISYQLTHSDRFICRLRPHKASLRQKGHSLRVVNSRLRPCPPPPGSSSPTVQRLNMIPYCQSFQPIGSLAQRAKGAVQSVHDNVGIWLGRPVGSRGALAGEPKWPAGREYRRRWTSSCPRSRQTSNAASVRVFFWPPSRGRGHSVGW